MYLLYIGPSYLGLRCLTENKNPFDLILTRSKVTVATEGVTVATEGVTEVLKKRGRGRPRKIDSLLNKEVILVKEDSGVEESGVVKEESGVKRGRGRPPKEKIENPKDLVKRGRGRPRKEKIEDPKDLIKRGRGRPRKEESKDLNPNGLNLGGFNKDSPLSMRPNGNSCVNETQELPKLPLLSTSNELVVVNAPRLEKSSEVPLSQGFNVSKVPLLDGFITSKVPSKESSGESSSEYTQSQSQSLTLIGSKSSLEQDAVSEKGEVWEDEWGNYIHEGCYHVFFIYENIIFYDKDKCFHIGFKDNVTMRKTVDGFLSFMKEIDKYKKDGFITEISIPYLDKIIKDLRVTKSDYKPTPNFYRWLLNLIWTSLYSFTLSLLKRNRDLKTLDDYLDLNELSKQLYSKLNPLIKSKLQTPGITALLNMYCGFDTEYETKDESKFINQLLSRQLAINTRLILKLPTFNDFKPGYLHPLTSEFVEDVLSEKDEEVFSSSLLEYLGSSIKKIRDFKSGERERVIEEITRVVKSQPCYSFESKDKLYYLYNLTEVKKDIKFLEKYSFSDLIKESLSISEVDLRKSLSKVFEILRVSGVKVENIDGKLDKLVGKKVVRYNFDVGGENLSLSIYKKLFVCCHFSNADLTMLSDFNEIKNELDIVHKNFVTLGMGLKREEVVVYLRDTSLLAPAGKKSLEAVGTIYSTEFHKIRLPDKYRGNMRMLLEEDKDLFEKYAIQDSVTTLKHANTMEEFFTLFKKVGVPITLSAIGRTYVLNEWGDKNLNFINNNFSELRAMFSRQGLECMKDLGLFLSYFIAALKGGRNESYMYGYDFDTTWLDYDLSGAYTSILSYLGTPNYRKVKVLTLKNLTRNVNNPEFFLENYIAAKVKFSFPKETKYPSIPCSLDNTAVVYPLSGETVITGPEYLLALRQNCDIKMEHGVIIPFTRVKDDDDDGGEQGFKTERPFFEIIKSIQSKRKEYPPKSLYNLLYKEIGNSIYGNIVRGYSNKKVFDVKTNEMKYLDGNELSNPIWGSYTTSLIRSVIGESLHNISKMVNEKGDKAKVVSVTTDGFITDVVDLESKLIEMDSGDRPLLNHFKKLRKNLHGDDTAFEVKHKGRGILSWCTRGQLGYQSNIRASTGFQAGAYTQSELFDALLDLFKGEKELEFIQKSLRGANDIYKKGGQVTMLFKERSYKLFYDNRRIVIKDDSKSLLDSDPLSDVQMSKTLRELLKVTNEKVYNKTLSQSSGKTYKSSLDSAVRTFIKGLLAEPPYFGLEKHKDEFKSYKEIIDFIKACPVTKNAKISVSSLSHLKHRKLIIKPVGRSGEIEEFVDYIKSKLVNFEEKEFLKF